MASNLRRKSTGLHNDVSDTAVCIPQRCHWHFCVTNFVEFFREWSETLFLCRNLTRLHTAHQCHWHRCEWVWTSYSRGSGYLEREYLYIEKTYGTLANCPKLQYIYSLTFKHKKIWGLTKNRFLSKRCHWHRCDQNRRFRSRFSIFFANSKPYSKRI
jgi:hypothetical protein